MGPSIGPLSFCASKLPSSWSEVGSLLLRMYSFSRMIPGAMLSSNAISAFVGEEISFA